MRSFGKAWGILALGLVAGCGRKGVPSLSPDRFAPPGGTPSEARLNAPLGGETPSPQVSASPSASAGASPSPRVVDPNARWMAVEFSLREDKSDDATPSADPPAWTTQIACFENEPLEFEHLVTPGSPRLGHRLFNPGEKNREVKEFRVKFKAKRDAEGESVWLLGSVAIDFEHVEDEPVVEAERQARLERSTSQQSFRFAPGEASWRSELTLKSEAGVAALVRFRVLSSTFSAHAAEEPALKVCAERGAGTWGIGH